MSELIKQLKIGPMGNFAYIVGDQAAGVCAVIDPGWDVSDIIEETGLLGLKIVKILLTHTHYDHSREVAALAKETGAQVFVHKDEPLESRMPSVESFGNGDKIVVGSLELTCLHVPGHSKGSTCFKLGNALFTGDTLFVDGIGRCDLPGGDENEMLESLKKLAKLPDETVIYPGHDYGSNKTSTIGAQKRSNPYMKL